MILFSIFGGNPINYNITEREENIKSFPGNHTHQACTITGEPLVKSKNDFFLPS